MSKIWIERRERDNGGEGEDRRISHVLYSVLEEGEYWPGMKRIPENLRPVIEASFWPPSAPQFGGPRDPQVSWPSTSDKRPRLARALALAMLYAAEEAETEMVPGPFTDGGTLEVPEEARQLNHEGMWWA